ncbi:MAG: porin [Cellvibrionaceae bacterium]
MKTKSVLEKTILGLGLTGIAALSIPSYAQGDLQSRVDSLEKEIRLLNDKTSSTKSSNTTFQYGGFLKLDAMWSDYSDAQRAGNVGDDFLVPSTIPVGDGSNGGDKVFDSNAKFSRLWLKTTTDTGAGKITGYIEMDFNGGNDERLTNQSSTGLRHAFATWDYSDSGSLLFGQTWSTFFNTAALPESADFIGPTSGTLFIRQSQMRWTKKMGDGNSLMLSAENPSVSVYDGGSGINDNNIDDSSLPDIVARFNGSAGNFSYSVAGIFREIAYDVGALDDDTIGIALSLSGKLAFNNGDDLKFMLSSGSLGRYIALNAYRDAAIEADGDIDLIKTTGGFIAYRHLWNNKLRSTISYAFSEADNPNSITPAATESASNLNVNLFYSPTKNLTFGGELILADRETGAATNADGDFKRLQLMAKWAF